MSPRTQFNQTQQNPYSQLKQFEIKSNVYSLRGSTTIFNRGNKRLEGNFVGKGAPSASITPVPVDYADDQLRTASPLVKEKEKTVTIITNGSALCGTLRPSKVVKSNADASLSETHKLNRPHEA